MSGACPSKCQSDGLVLLRRGMEMAHLDKLNITNRMIDAARRRKKVDTVEYRRAKLVANIEEQIELVNLALNNQPLELHRKRGHKIQKVRPRVWWTQEENGKVYTQIRYNKIALNLAGRGIAIEAGTMKNLRKVFQTVIKAVQAGELDRVVENAARKS